MQRAELAVPSKLAGADAGSQKRPDAPYSPDASSLLWRSLFVGVAVFHLGLALLGTWFTGRTVEAVLQHSAHTSATFMDSSLEPLIRSLETDGQLPP